MVNVAVHVDHDTLAVETSLVEEAVRAVLSDASVSNAEVTIVLSNRAAVHQLNREFLSHDYETDVLSFRLSDETGATLEGEVYVDQDTALHGAGEHDVEFTNEVLRYAIHGALHLVGYDDGDDAGRSEMRTLEDRYLAQIRDAP